MFAAQIKKTRKLWHGSEIDGVELIGVTVEDAALLKIACIWALSLVVRSTKPVMKHFQRLSVHSLQKEAV